jgi:hypothetical protein
MTTPPHWPASPAQPPPGQLAETLTTLAGTPDDALNIDELLITIARLTAGLVEPVSYASITANRAGAPTTVAASSQLAYEVDLAQYADRAGPCLDALSDGKPVEVPDVAAIMAWPGFRDTAWRLGLRASVSIPLFAASGHPIAALNLYAHDPDPMTALTRRVWALYDAGSLDHNDRLPTVQEGSQQLLAGIATAFDVRDLIQQALGAIMARHQVTADTAYHILRARAAEIGATLPATAATVVHEQDA